VDYIKETTRREITLLWVPSHEADNAAKEALNENLDRTEEYPPQDLANWIAEQHEEQQ
jgi:hypothetical protein